MGRRHVIVLRLDRACVVVCGAVARLVDLFPFELALRNAEITKDPSL